MSRLQIMKQIEEAVRVGTNISTSLDVITMRLIAQQKIPVHQADDFRGQLYGLVLAKHIEGKLLGQNFQIAIEELNGNT